MSCLIIVLKLLHILLKAFIYLKKCESQDVMSTFKSFLFFFFFSFSRGNCCLSGSLDNLSFSKGDIITVVDLKPIHVRAEMKDGEQTLGVVTIPLGYKGTVCKTLPCHS